MAVSRVNKIGKKSRELFSPGLIFPRASNLNFKHDLQMRLYTELQKDTGRIGSRRCLS